MKHLKLLLILFALACLPQSLQAAEGIGAGNWSDETLDLYAHLPVQDQGRTKPFNSYAGFELVQVNGAMKFRAPDKSRVPGLAWLLDCWYYPEQAADYKVVRIENPTVMQALGLDDSKKRTRFSYNDIKPHESKLWEMAQMYSQIDRNQRTIVQQQIMNAYQDYAALYMHLNFMNFARLEFNAEAGTPLANILAQVGYEARQDGSFKLRYSDLLPHLPALLEYYRSNQFAEGAEDVKHIIHQLEDVSHTGEMTTLFPQITHPNHETWLSPGGMMREIAERHLPNDPVEIKHLALMEKLVDQLDNRPAFNKTLAALVDGISEDAIAQGQYEHVGLEVTFYNMNLFRKSLVFYIIGFLLIAFTWLLPRNRWLWYGAVVMTVIPTILLVVGITLRCIIRARPPVTTLYETTLFIPAVAIIVAMAIEFINRKRVGLALASVMGCIGLFLANKFELRGSDTMESMVAVLDSNFWLATHVTTVTMGYSAGLLAAMIAHVYIIGHLIGFGRRKDFFKNIGRMTYGIICFGTLFSFVGTVLGGIWANDSWGRFWGWDPKENGALMIILWNLFILHGRLGGYLRDLGVAIAAVFGGIIVGFSWWGVNMLNVGLHSYGAISGVQKTLYGFWAIEMVVILLGFVVVAQRMGQKLVEKQQKPQSSES